MSGFDNRTSRLGIFERWLSLWVALAIIGGIGLGVVTPEWIANVAALEIASVNLVVEVPPMLSLVAFANRTRGRFPRST